MVLEYKRNCELKPGMIFPEGMKRVAMGVEYCGSAFHGFQKQQSASETVQAHLERALSRVANEDVTLVCAGRTDAGVHATNQVIHFDTLANRQEKSWLKGVNTYLPGDIAIKWVKPVGPGFHARFSADSRTYRYIFFSNKVRPALSRNMVTWTGYSLDLNKMREAAKYLVGEHDFSSFRAAQCQAASPIRTVEAVEFFPSGRFFVMEIRANAFLHHMVRNISGALLDIGRGAKPVEWMQVLLDLRDRTKAAPTAHPYGLYLVNVDYPEEFGLPIEPYGPDFVQKPEIL